MTSLNESQLEIRTVVTSASWAMSTSEGQDPPPSASILRVQSTRR